MEEEVLVYDPELDRAHCLNATASFIWRQADGTRDVGELARLLSETFGRPATDEIVLLALDRLQRAHLLEGGFWYLPPDGGEDDPGGVHEPPSEEETGGIAISDPPSGMAQKSEVGSDKETRRQAIRRMARVGVALPAVVTMALPSPLQAATQIAGIDCWRNPEENRGKCCTNGRECIQWGRIGLCIGRRC